MESREAVKNIEHSNQSNANPSLRVAEGPNVPIIQFFLFPHAKGFGRTLRISIITTASNYRLPWVHSYIISTTFYFPPKCVSKFIAA